MFIWKTTLSYASGTIGGTGGGDRQMKLNKSWEEETGERRNE